MKAAGFAALSLALALGCDNPVADEGADASFVIPGATFVRGSLPEESGGPKVRGLDLGVNQVRPGSVATKCAGTLEPAARSVVLGLAGDRGYWVVRAKTPGLQAPDSPVFDASFDVSAKLPEGTYTILARAVDDAGHVGALYTRPVRVAAGVGVAAHLVITLRWEGVADLDLRVADPTGAEISRTDINSVPAPTPGTPVDPNAYKKGGILDFDSNAACVFDGRDEENVFYREPPPRGHYVVRVDATSLCGAAGAAFSARAVLDGKVLTQASGTVGDGDTRFPSQNGSGLRVLEFDVP